MKKLLVVLMVLSMASAANAALFLSVNGSTEVEEITIAPSDNLVLDIHGDGSQGPGIFFMGISVDGPASLDISNAAILYGGNDIMIDWMDDEGAGLAEAMGIKNPFVLISLSDIPTPPTPAVPLTGLLVDLIQLHCDGIGQAVVMLYDGDLGLLDSVIVNQIPEPITMVLLGLGGLFLRRRK